MPSTSCSVQSSQPCRADRNSRSRAKARSNTEHSSRTPRQLPVLCLRFLACGVNSAPNTYRGSAAACAVARGCRRPAVWKIPALPRPRNMYVPSCRPIQERCWRAIRQFVPGSGEGQRSGESRGALADVVEREGVSNQEKSLPGVCAHDADAASERPALRHC